MDSAQGRCHLGVEGVREGLLSRSRYDCETPLHFPGEELRKLFLSRLAGKRRSSKEDRTTIESVELHGW
jgi:hypothetical protein